MTYTPSSKAEQDFLQSYDPSGFPSVAMTSDIVLFTIKNGQLCVLLVERGDFPYKGYWALPGGFVNPNEDSDEAARRELQEETGLEAFPGHLEQLKSYSSPERDPRMRVISTAYVALMPDLPTPVAGDDAANAHFWPVDDLDLSGSGLKDDAPALAFDHAQIISDALERVRSKLEYTPLATSFCAESFTLVELRRIYEAVWGVELHPSNFRRKVLSTPGFVSPVGSKAHASSSGGRPAQLYTKGNATLLHPAMLQPGADAGQFDEDPADGGLA